MCNAYDINGCEQQGSIKLKYKSGKILTHKGIELNFCSEECANEYAAEISEGTWCPFPNAHGAMTPDQIKNNLEEFDYRYE